MKQIGKIILFICALIGLLLAYFRAEEDSSLKYVTIYDDTPAGEK